jgi:hypothetical protein
VRQASPTLGTITKSFGGSGPFEFPRGINTDVLTFGFALQLTASGPASGAAVRRFGYIVAAAPTTEVRVTCCENFATYLVLPTTQPPAPFRYGPVVFDTFTDLPLRIDATAVGVGAAVALVPEPATIAFTAAGLAGAGLTIARRRRT